MKQQRNLYIALAIVFFLMLSDTHILVQLETKQSIQQETIVSQETVSPQNTQKPQATKTPKESENLEANYDDIRPLIDGAMVVIKNNKYGLIKNGGKVIVEPKYDFIGEFSGDNGTRSFEEDNLWGYFDKNGNVIIEPQFNDASNFYDGKAKVRKGVNVYYIDIHGKIIGTAK